MRKRSVAMLAVVGLGAGGALVMTQFASGAGGDEAVFVPSTPCRLVDTRSGVENVGPRSVAIGPDETATFNAHDGIDADSPCAIPSTATAISANVVAVAPTAAGFVATFPGDEDNPGTATLNFVAGQAPTPNAAIIPLAANGSFKVFNAFGSVDIIIDVNGFYQPSTSIGDTGPAGPEGPQGPEGPEGPPGPAFIPGYEIVEGPLTTISSIDTFTADADCPSGKVALGGGGAELGDADGGFDNSDWEIRESRPKPDGSGWQIELRPTNTVVSGAGRAYAVCATGSAPTTTP